MDVAQTAERVRAGDLSAEELVAAALTAARASELGAFLHLCDDAVERARRLDARRDGGEHLGPLAGVPIAVKDNIVTRAVPTTAGSRILEGWVPPYDAEVVRRLEDADAVIVGKTSMDELGMGSSNEHCAFGPARNPWDPTRTPGGSSGGSAAAVAARIVSVALGSDTGGSVRLPASFCGVTALKPAYGRVSRRGLVAFASSLDQIGPIGRTVRDVAHVHDVIAGHDPADPTSLSQPAPSLSRACGRDPAGLRVAVVDDALSEEVAAPVREAVRCAAEVLGERGCAVRSMELPVLRRAVSIYYLVSTAEASSNLSRLDGIRYGRRVPAADVAETYARTRAAGFGDEVKRRILLGTYALSAGYYDALYLRAQKARTLVIRALAAALSDVDALLLPVAPTTAFPLGDRQGDPLSMYLTDVFTVPASLAGLPAMSVPVGFDDAGLPTGVQLVGRADGEPALISLASAIEAAVGAVDRAPPG